MANPRITLRLPHNHLKHIDLFIKIGKFSTRTEVIRHALNDFIYNNADEIIQQTKKIKKVQDLESNILAMEPYTLEK